MLCWELALGLFLAGKGAAWRWGPCARAPVSCAFLGSGAGADDARDGPACLENGKLTIVSGTLAYPTIFGIVGKHALGQLHTWYGAVHGSDGRNVEFILRCSRQLVIGYVWEIYIDSRVSESNKII